MISIQNFQLGRNATTCHLVMVTTETHRQSAKIFLRNRRRLKNINDEVYFSKMKRFVMQ